MSFCLHCRARLIYQPLWMQSLTQWVLCSECFKGTIAPSLDGLRLMKQFAIPDPTEGKYWPGGPE